MEWVEGLQAFHLLLFREVNLFHGENLEYKKKLV